MYSFLFLCLFCLSLFFLTGKHCTYKALTTVLHIFYAGNSISCAMHVNCITMSKEDVAGPSVASVKTPNGSTVFIVGVNHLSKESCDAVTRVYYHFLHVSFNKYYIGNKRKKAKCHRFRNIKRETPLCCISYTMGSCFFFLSLYLSTSLHFIFS